MEQKPQPQKCYCDYKSIQKAIVMLCYFVYLVWSYLKLQFEKDPGFTNVANKVDIIIAVCMGALLKLATGLGSGLRAVSDVLPSEMSARFDSILMLNKEQKAQIDRMATSMDLLRRGTQSFPPDARDPFGLEGVPETVTEQVNTARSEIHFIDMADGRRVEIKIPHDLDQ